MVDDEKKSLEVLEWMIKMIYPTFQIIAKIQDPLRAIEYIQEQDPDLVFLDLSMPYMDGLQVYSQISTVSGKVVFTTAHHGEKLNNLKASKYKYLLKPIDLDEIAKTLNTLVCV